MKILLKACVTSLLAFGLTCTSVAAATMHADRFPVRTQFDGVELDITTFEGTFVDNVALLISQPWWGRHMAEVNGIVFGASETGPPDNFLSPYGSLRGYGPFFALTVSQELSVVDGLASECCHPFNSLRVDPFANIAYAVATPAPTASTPPVPPVPLPAAGLLLLTGLALTARIGRRGQTHGS
jgi:hypothetical protein